MTDPTKTHIEFLLDRSGSMAAIKLDVEGGFTTFIAEQRAHPGACTVSLSQFDDHYETVYTALPVAAAPPLVLVPRGMTALLDAIGRTVVALGERLAALSEHERPGTVIVAIMTDGLENASTEFTRPAIKALIETQEREFSWQFLYMGANQDAIEVGEGLGVRRDRSLTYAPGAAQQAYEATSITVSQMRSAAAAGAPLSDIGYTDEQREAAAPKGRRLR